MNIRAVFFFPRTLFLSQHSHLSAYFPPHTCCSVKMADEDNLSDQEFDNIDELVRERELGLCDDNQSDTSVMSPVSTRVYYQVEKRPADFCQVKVTSFCQRRNGLTQQKTAIWKILSVSLDKRSHWDMMQNVWITFCNCSHPKHTNTLVQGSQ